MVRAAKYLHANGCTIKRIYLSAGGDSAYVKAKIGTRHFTIRFSGHPSKRWPLYGITKNGRGFGLPSTWPWSQLRAKIKHYVVHHAAPSSQ